MKDWILDRDRDDNDNSFLFFKIWRNYVIKKLIFKHLMMFNLLSFSVDIDSLHQPFIQDNKQYIKSLFIKVDNIKENANEIYIYEMGEILNNLPNHIESIRLYQTNNIKFGLSNLKLPSSLKKLITHYNFNLPLSNSNSAIFSNLTTLEFGYKFNNEIGVNILPNSLKKLKFGNYYTQPLNENVLPHGLKTIIFGDWFNQTLKNLPNSIEEIKFNSKSYYKTEINSIELPQSLKKLSLPRNFNMSLINGILPNKLEKLKISSLNVDTSDIGHRCLKHLKLKVYNKNGNLSSSNQEILNLLKLDISKIIPPSVTNLSIFYNTFQPSFKKPFSPQFCKINLNTTKSKLRVYDLYYESSKLLLDKFERIKSLKVNLIENNFKLDNHSCLKGLINLNLNEFNYLSYAKPIKDFKVFTQLKCLRIGDYNSTINSNTLPPSLELLELGNRFKQSIHKKWLPASIKYIIVLNDETPISINSLPDSLDAIWITDNHYQLKDFKFFTPLIGKLKINDSELIWKVFNKIFKKKYELYLY
ncbi:hypothetical protein ACTFIU_010306 [Dictyostelium citrinum]